MKVAAVTVQLQIDAGPNDTRDTVRQFADEFLSKLNVDSSAVLYQMIQPSTIGVENGWDVDVLLPMGGE